MRSEDIGWTIIGSVVVIMFGSVFINNGLTHRAVVEHQVKACTVVYALDATEKPYISKNYCGKNLNNEAN